MNTTLSHVEVWLNIVIITLFQFLPLDATAMNNKCKLTPAAFWEDHISSHRMVQIIKNVH